MLTFRIRVPVWNHSEMKMFVDHRICISILGATCKGIKFVRVGIIITTDYYSSKNYKTNERYQCRSLAQLLLSRTGLCTDSVSTHKSGVKRDVTKPHTHSLISVKASSMDYTLRFTSLLYLPIHTNTKGVLTCLNDFPNPMVSS